MTSDSESEEENERLKEAVDPNFLEQNLYCKSKNEKINQPIKKKPTSYQNMLYTQTKFTNPFAINVSPEFRKFISNHLSKILDDSIEETVFKTTKKKEKQQVYNGIKLLKNSKYYLTLESKVQDKKILKKHLKEKKIKASNFEEKAKEVAVSGEWVLSQKETEHWAVINKGEVEIVKCCSKS